MERIVATPRIRLRCEGGFPDVQLRLLVCKWNRNSETVSELFVVLDVLNWVVQVPSLSYLLKYGVSLVQSLFLGTLEEHTPFGVKHF